MIPKNPCNGANATDAWAVCVSPGDCRRCKLASKGEGWPYGLNATGLPSLVLQGRGSRIIGSPAACFTDSAKAGPAVSVAAAARKLRFRKPRRSSLKPLALISFANVGGTKFSGAFFRRPMGIDRWSLLRLTLILLG